MSQRKAIAPGGAAGLQTRLGTASVPGQVRLRLPSASLQKQKIAAFVISYADICRRCRKLRSFDLVVTCNPSYPAKYESLSEITLRFHPIMQGSDDCDPIGCDSKLDHVALDTAAPISGTNSVACRCCSGALGKLFKGCGNDIYIAIGLIQTPLLCGITPDRLKVHFGGGGKAVLSHVRSTFFS